MATFDDVALGTYKCLTMEGADEFNEAIGMPKPIQEMMSKNVTNMLFITEKDGDGYNFRFSMGPGTPEVVDKFKLGETFTGKDVMGNELKNRLTFEDGKAIEEREAPNYKMKITREFKDNKLYMTSEAKGKVAKYVWEKC